MVPSIREEEDGKDFHDKEDYFFVMKGGVVAHKSELLAYPVFRERLAGLLGESMTVVIDEFQRLPTDFLDYLHFLSPESKAKLILVGSSLSVARRGLEAHMRPEDLLTSSHAYCISQPLGL